MELAIAAALWLGGWFVIIICNVMCVYINRVRVFQDNFASDEIVKDGNNLFTTGLVYFIFTLACYFFSFTIFHWIFFIVFSLVALFCTLSCFPRFFTFGISVQKNLSIISAFISQCIPLAMMINILKFNILN